MKRKFFISRLSEATGRQVPEHVARELMRNGVLLEVPKPKAEFEFSQDHLDSAIEHLNAPRCHDWPAIQTKEQP